MTDWKPAPVAPSRRRHLNNFTMDRTSWRLYVQSAQSAGYLNDASDVQAAKRLFDDASDQQRQALVSILRATWVMGFEARTEDY